MLYVGGGVLNAHATDELLALAEAGRLPVVTTLMAKGAFPETHELHFGWPGMHGPKWSNWALNKGDLHRRRRRPLRRPRDRQALGVRAGRDGRPPRHRRRGDLEAAPRRRPGRRPAEARARRAREARSPTSALPGRDRAVAAADRANGASSSRSRYSASRRPMLKPQRVLRDAAGAHRRSRRHRLDDRRRPAPDVGDAVPALRPAALVHHLRRARHDGLRAAGGDRREGRAAGRDRDLRGRRRLVPDDLAGARHRGARRAADRRRDRQQRLPRDGAPVAGHVLRRALLAGPAHALAPRLRGARRVRTAALGFTVENEEELEPALATALASGRRASSTPASIRGSTASR